jgi:hypothetical protein
LAGNAYGAEADRNALLHTVLPVPTPPRGEEIGGATTTKQQETAWDRVTRERLTNTFVAGGRGVPIVTSTRTHSHRYCAALLGPTVTPNPTTCHIRWAVHTCNHPPNIRSLSTPLTGAAPPNSTSMTHDHTDPSKCCGGQLA